MSAVNPNVGIRGTARNPSSIANSQNHDATQAQRTIAGSPLSISLVVPTSTVATAVENNAVIRVANVGATVQYLWAGREDLVPGTVSATNGIALMPNSVENFCCPASDDSAKAIVVKSSNSQVQIVIMAG